MPGDSILGEARAAAGRSLVWFAAFALFAGVAWTARGRTLALGVGAAALLLNLGVSGGLNFSAVAGLLWVTLALTAPAPKPSAGPPGVGHYLALPALAALVLFFFLNVFYPVTTAAGEARRALATGRTFLDEESKALKEGKKLPRIPRTNS